MSHRSHIKGSDWIGYHKRNEEKFRLKLKRRCPWTKCWWGAIVVPGECFENGNMEDPNCPLFKDEEETLAEQSQFIQKKKGDE